jgi:hypothetical protein
MPPNVTVPLCVEFLSGCRCVLSRRRPPPPESRGRPSPLCARTTSSLPDALSALPRRATRRRPLDFGALPACSLPCRLQVLFNVRHLKGGLELLTGLHPPPGDARLELWMQARSLTSDEHRTRIDANQREPALAGAHVDALLQERRGGGPVMANILQADCQLVCSLTSFLGERPERLSTFPAGSDADVAKVERLHAYPRAVCKRALLPTCCSDTPPTLFAYRRWAAKCVVIQVRSGQVQRRADAVPHASCSLRRASSSPRRPVK